MTDQQIVVVEKKEIMLGSLEVDPQRMISVATEKARLLATVIKDRKLYSNISGKNYVRVEGWSTLGAMLGILPREASVIEQENGDVEATVELIRVSDGAVVGRGSAIVGIDEKTWANRPRYARRSMAITRATGKAFRLGFSWIMSLAGYEPTPAEEIEGLYTEEPKRAPVKTAAQAVSELYNEPAPKAVKKDEQPEAEYQADAFAGVCTEEGQPYSELSMIDLSHRFNSLSKAKTKDPSSFTPEQQRKLDAAKHYIDIKKV